MKESEIQKLKKGSYIISAFGERGDTAFGEDTFTGHNAVGQVTDVFPEQEDAYSVAFPRGISVFLSAEELSDDNYLFASGVVDAGDPYTVICLYPDYITGDFGADIYVNTVAAKDAYKAASDVQLMAMEANSDTCCEPEDFRVIAVIKGDVTLELDASNFC
jgi:hypothetical protein